MDILECFKFILQLPSYEVSDPFEFFYWDLMGRGVYVSPLLVVFHSIYLYLLIYNSYVFKILL